MTDRIVRHILLCRSDQKWERLISTIRSFMTRFSSEFIFFFLCALTIFLRVRFKSFLACWQLIPSYIGRLWFYFNSRQVLNSTRCRSFVCNRKVEPPTEKEAGSVAFRQLQSSSFFGRAILISNSMCAHVHETGSSFHSNEEHHLKKR